MGETLRSRQARIMRTAISPRFATKILRNIGDEGLRPEVRDQKSEVRSQKSEVRIHHSVLSTQYSALSTQHSVLRTKARHHTKRKKGEHGGSPLYFSVGKTYRLAVLPKGTAAPA